MGYSLARSKTVSDLPGWAQTGSKVKRKHSSVSDYSSQDMTASKSNISTLGTVSTLGSLRSKIVRHKTLLGSSSRLYKFSQSLSSLTTLGTESRASLSSTLRSDNLAWSLFSWTSLVIYDNIFKSDQIQTSKLNNLSSRDPNMLEPIMRREASDR